MTGPESVVVVGGGLAAAKAVEELRAAGFERRITLVGEEHHLPYERPPLSKGYLLGKSELEAAFVHPPDWYDENDVDLHLGTRVTGIDLGGHRVLTAGGDVDYGRLLLATGASPRRFPAADAGGAPVAYLRVMEDSQRIREALDEGRRIAVLGGGWIGLEVAAAAREAGCEVTVLEALDMPLVRVLGPEVARVFADLHVSHGVDLRTGVTVTAVERVGDRVVVRLEDGEPVEADLLVVGVGVSPADALAAEAGLEVDDGVLVDAHLRTADADVYAAGDVANVLHPVLGTRLRVEHWDNAIEQGRTAARNLLGREEPYERLPYFFTDQYDLGMEYVGHVGRNGYDRVVLRGDVAGAVFTAFWLRGGRVVAGMHANDWDAIGPVRRIVGRELDPARLADGTLPLEQLASDP